MEISAIRNALHRQPFQPFQVRLADGRAFHIPHPDFAAIAQRQVIITSPTDSSWSVIDSLLVVSLDYSGNGQPASPQGGTSTG
jgi:hypothetical protein